MMKKKLSKLMLYVIAMGLLFIGLGVVYYAFELVSVPHVTEYSEGGFISVGLILAICGLVVGIFHFRKAKQQTDNPQTTSPPTM